MQFRFSIDLFQPKLTELKAIWFNKMMLLEFVNV